MLGRRVLEVITTMTYKRPSDRSSLHISQLAIQSISRVSAASLIFSYQPENSGKLLPELSSMLKPSVLVSPIMRIPQTYLARLSSNSTHHLTKTARVKLEEFIPGATVLAGESNLTICTGVTVSRIKFSGDETEPPSSLRGCQLGPASRAQVSNLLPMLPKDLP